MTARARLLAGALGLALTGSLLASGAAAGPAGPAGPAGVAGSPGRAPSAGSAGMGDPYFGKDGNGGIDVVHYDIRNGYAFGSGRLRGRTALDVVATKDLSRFNLDFLLPVSSVRVAGRPARFSRSGDHELRIRPRRALAAGEQFRVVVRYDGYPARESSGGERNWLADRSEVVTMNEPHMATWWFPANDHPRDKASFDIRITVPRGTDVVANGQLAGRSRQGRRTTTHWRVTEPMATFLAFFAAGRFEVRTGSHLGRPWYVAVSKQVPASYREASLRALGRSAELTAWLESRLGAYPFSSTGGLVTGLDVQFALENQTRPTYPWRSAATTTLQVHELAHQWFGDSVSVQDWRDIWLNEGFATFMQVHYDEAHGGLPAQAWLLAAYEQRPPGDPFWQLAIGDPGRRHLFDTAVYDRGAMAVQALRHRIGEAAFWQLVRTWLDQRRYRNGSVADFAALAESVSGADLDGFFQAWLYTPQRPTRTPDNGLV